ncbi:ATP-dependent DNA ligase [Brevibacillus reuszeri]|uniref:ATP-dependent DNA ligase n=1 Tax=Brevibacillus reuszeri TaxID=54915 RepID=UPI000CCC5D2D|nr:DNA ligase [Brevibacillus reuszeri]
MLNTPIKPMLLQPSPTVITKDGWKHALKYDGMRVLLHYDNGTCRAFTRHGNEITSSFYPELKKIDLPIKNGIFDSEAIILDPTTSPPKPIWDDVMVRFHTKKERAIASLSQSLPTHFVCWDTLWINDQSLIHEDFNIRRQALEKYVSPTDVMSVAPLYEDGAALFARAKELGLEGICSYNTNSGPKSHYYLDSRPSDVWVKTKAYQYVTCQISSIRKSKFGWGLSINGKYVGVLEFPPTAAITKDFYMQARHLKRRENKDWYFIDPLISCTIKFQCFTRDGKLRSPKIESLSFDCVG